MKIRRNLDQSFIVEFGGILVIAALLGAVARLLKQPLVLAYLVAGIIIGPLALGLAQDIKVIETFAHIGIVFLLFLVGLELNPRKLLEVGNTALVAGFFQIISTAILYYLVSTFFGFTSTSSIYIALAFTFSSTAIIITLLSNRDDLDSLHGKILIGILLVQDFVALLLLTIMSAMQSAQIDISVFEFAYKTVFRSIILFGSTYLISKYILPAAFNRIAKSHELLFLSSLAWCFFLAVASISLGFSAEIGAFIAGISLATLPYSIHVAAKTKPLRDFFIMIFFIYLGTNLVFEDALAIVPQALIISLIILLINPLVVSFMVSVMGYRKRTSFLTGITLTQSSEFAFIVIVLGVKLGILPQNAITLTSLVAIITIFISTYLIARSQKIYSKLKDYLFFLHTKSKRNKLENLPEKMDDHTILIGYHRIGSSIYETLTKNKEKVAVIDYDPRQIKPLLEEGGIGIYGDAIDHEVMDNLHIKKAKMVISTIGKYEESMAIIEEYKKINKKIEIIMTANDEQEAVDLYEAGADLVVVPDLISGDYLSYLLKRIDDKKTSLSKIRDREIKALEKNSTDPYVVSFAKKKRA